MNKALNNEIGMYSVHRLITLIIVGALPLCASAQVEEPLTGMFRITSNTTELIGAPTAQQLDRIISVEDELQWQLYVPEDYDRSTAPGIFVYIDPNGSGIIPDQWRQTFVTHNLIWISARNVDKRVTLMKQLWTAILAVRAIDLRYAVDLNRVFVGSTGGGIDAAVNAMISTSEFVGGLYISGSMYWGDNPPDLSAFRRKRHVFITGSNDDASNTVRRDYQNYRDEGIRNVKLIFETDILRNPPPAELIDEALTYLAED